MRRDAMDVKILNVIPPWEWPEDADKTLLAILGDARAAASDRLLSAELASNITVINDDLVAALLTILRDGEASEKLRGQAAISLGPVLEQADIDGFEDPDDVPIAEATFHRIRDSLRKLYVDAGVPTYVRRRILEAAVRAQQDWQADAIRAAYASGDEAWRLTAVFCMRYVPGFEQQIVEALDNRNSDIHYEAVCAAGNWEVDAAWPHVTALVAAGDSEKGLLRAAIEAIASIRPREAAAVLDDLADSDDEDIVAAVSEALTMAAGLSGLEDEEDEEPRP